MPLSTRQFPLQHCFSAVIDNFNKIDTYNPQEYIPNEIFDIFFLSSVLFFLSTRLCVLHLSEYPTDDYCSLHLTRTHRHKHTQFRLLLCLLSRFLLEFYYLQSKRYFKFSAFFRWVFTTFFSLLEVNVK